MKQYLLLRLILSLSLSLTPALTGCGDVSPVQIEADEGRSTGKDVGPRPEAAWGDPLKWPTSISDFKLPFSGRHNTCTSEYWKVICGYTCGYHTNAYYPGAGTYSIDLVRVDGRTIDSAVLVSARGTVAFAGWKTGYGNCVEMDHGNGFKSIYAHLRENPWKYVSTGDDLRAGTFLGWASDTGWANPPHIHFSVWRSNRSISLDGISGYARIQEGATYCSGLARVPSPKNSPL